MFFSNEDAKKFNPRNSAFTSFIAAFIHQVVLSKFLQQTFKLRAF